MIGARPVRRCGEIPLRDFIMGIPYIHVSHRSMGDPYIAGRIHLDHIWICASKADT